MSEQPSPSPSMAPSQAPRNPIVESIRQLDRTSQIVAGAGIVVALAALIGTATGLWSMQYAGLILIVVGVGGALLAWLVASRPMPAMPLTAPDLVLAAATSAAALGILALVTLLADLDQVGGALDVVLTLVLAAAGVAMLYGALASGGARAAWSAAMSSSRGIRLGLAGTALVMLGWVGNLTIGVWNFSPSAVVVTLAAIGAVVLLAAARSGGVVARPVALSWIAVVLAALATLIMVDHFAALSRQSERSELGLDNWLIFAVYAVGVVGFLAGSVLTAIDERSVAPAIAPAAEPETTPDSIG